ncbi:MAG: tyrosine recombinase [Chloroflexi bacterium]|nr:tyrosine recombinase [Chloroflexota bacterium]
MMRASVDDFVQHLKTERGLSKNTLAAYRSDLRQFETFVRKAGHSGWDVPPQVVRSFMTDLIQREYRQTSRARKLAAVKALYRYLLSSGTVATDPTAGLDGARVTRRRPRIISPAEVERLLEQAADASTPERMRDRAMLEALYATGMRVSELVGLDVEDVDCWEREILLGRDGASARTVPLTERAAEALQAYLTNGREKLLRRVDEPAVFLNHRGNRLTRQGFWLIVKAYAQRSNIQTPITPHTLRHSFAAHRLQGDSSVREVQKLLGHASPATTQVYAELARENRPQAPGGTGGGHPA